jgi:hypothetical protein
LTTIKTRGRNIDVAFWQILLKKSGVIDELQFPAVLARPADEEREGPHRFTQSDPGSS